VKTKLVKINLFRNDMKFSAAHFTIFSATKRENIHGHNYYITASLTSKVNSDGISNDYRIQRKKIIDICKNLNEHFLIAKDSPHLTIKNIKDSVTITFNNKSMTIPQEEIKLLPLRNISSEELAYFFLHQLTENKKEMKEQGIIAYEIGVSTTIGHSSTASWRSEGE
jgi:6-pyruvoyltetrahydropterin/6-carboxytetrahydropterin synthase